MPPKDFPGDFPLAPQPVLRLIVVVADSGRTSRRAGSLRWLPAWVAGGLVASAPVRAQGGGDLSLPALVGQAEALLDEALRDGEVTLPGLDPERVSELLPDLGPDTAEVEDSLRELLGRLEGEYVLDLAPLRRAVDLLLPLLEAHEPLRDLGAWLRCRRDYFDVLDTLTVRVPARGATNGAPVVAPGTSPPTAPTAPKPAVPSERRPEPVTPPRGGGGLTNRVTVEMASAREASPVPVTVGGVPPGHGAPAPSAAPAPPTARRENPGAEALRGAWTRQVAGRPPPPEAGRWVRRLKPHFAAAGVPAELVWLAEVESGFDPRARSPSGAVGLYQLMPVTARSLGLDTFPFDERRNPEKSARAAARYLAQLRDQFGDWPLALAAYNAGPARVRSLLVATQARTFAAISPRLPVEAQLYVPKFAAVLEQREGRRLEDLPVRAAPTPAARRTP